MKTKMLAEEKWLGYSFRTTEIRKLIELDQVQSLFFASFFEVFRF